MPTGPRYHGRPLARSGLAAIRNCLTPPPLNSVEKGSKWAHFICFCTASGLGSLLEKRVFAPLFTHFGPTTAHCQGILAFSMGRNGSTRAQNGLKTLV